MRAAAYSGTKNLYENMLTAAKSLLEHSNVEQIYFLIEDDIFPYELPEEITCINISNQTYFHKDSPNFNNCLTYMVLIRAAYSKIFPDLDRILTIDVDTIVNENISELWDLDLTDYYIAGVEETALTKAEGSYINLGVAMLNLQKIREEHKDDEMIEALNTFWYRYCEQDCMNEFFRDHSLILPSDYNACQLSDAPEHEKITHFAGIVNWKNFPQFNYYHNLPIDKIIRNKPDNITLDIIIPTYKNKKGLRKTLESIDFDQNINVIVVDDCSNLDYSDILKDYPLLKFYQLDKNAGPGMARQYGMEHSNGTYIMFLDTGDYFYDEGLERVLEQINKNTYIKLYSWSYVFDKNNQLMDEFDTKTIGKVYKRSFIETYNIHFCEKGSYANEDFGFIQACRIILDSFKVYKFSNQMKHIKIPVFYEHYDKNSITQRNNREFFYTKLIKGIATNGLHAIEITKNFVNMPPMQEVCSFIALEYYYFLCIVYERPDLLDDIWPILRNFYFNSYYKYKKFAKPFLTQAFYGVTLPRIKKHSANWNKRVMANIERFIQELEEETLTPVRYFSFSE